MRIQKNPLPLGERIAREIGATPMLVRTVDSPEWGVSEITRIIAAMEGKWGHESTIFAEAEAAFAGIQRLDKAHGVTTVANGSVSLLLILEALDIGYGDTVVVPGLTWQATATAVLDVNAVPIFGDVGRRTQTLDLDWFERYLERLENDGAALPKAVIVVHLYHKIAEMNRIVEICRRFGVFLIEDCAHAHGGEYDGRPVGTFGIAASFSGEGSKTLPSQEGGVIVTGVPALDQRVRSGRSCGRTVDASDIDLSTPADELTRYWRRRFDAIQREYLPGRAGLEPTSVHSTNYRMTPTTAALMIAQCERFPRQQAERVATLRQLDRALADVPGIRRLPLAAEETKPIAYKYAFAYDPEAFAHMPNGLFREVLSFLLGGTVVVPVYDPLGGGEAGYRSPVYNPHSKKRYHINAEHWAAIDPSRFALPECHFAHASVVTIVHEFLREPRAAEALVQAISWMRENAEQIVARSV